MEQTEADVQMLTEFATFRAAAAAGVRVDGMWSTSALTSELSKINPRLAASLMEFLTAYRDWFEFHRDIEQQGKDGRLSPAALQRLVAVVTARNTTREHLLTAIRKAEASRKT